MSRLAEQLLANMLGLEWDPYKTIDPGYDLLMGDITIDVKHALRCSREGCHLPVKRDHFIADVYILTVGNNPEVDPRVVGFISGLKSQRYPVWDRTSGPPAHWVPEDALTEMTYIYDKLYEMWPKRFAAYIEQAYPRSAWEIT
jgi:hypothetical protein